MERALTSAHIAPVPAGVSCVGSDGLLRADHSDQEERHTFLSFQELS